MLQNSLLAAINISCVSVPFFGANNHADAVDMFHPTDNALSGSVLVYHVGRTAFIAAFTPPAARSLPPSITSFTGWRFHTVDVGFLQIQINLFDNELAFLVFLRRFIGSLVRPAHQSITSLTENIANGVQAGDEQSIFWGPFRHIDALIEQVGASSTTVKGLGNDIIVTCQVRATLLARVHLRTIQVHHGIVHFQGRTSPFAHNRIVRNLAISSSSSSQGPETATGRDMMFQVLKLVSIATQRGGSDSTVRRRR